MLHQQRLRKPNVLATVNRYLVPSVDGTSHDVYTIYILQYSQKAPAMLNSKIVALAVVKLCH